MLGSRIPVTLGNIEPLAYKPYLPQKIALVCEGGGQRGIFTAGVLDEFQRAGFNPFDLLIGTSAGAQNLSAYVCGQPGYARRVITRYTTSAEFFNPLRFVRGGHLIDLDWLVDVTSKNMPLAMERAEKLLIDGREFLMCACRSDDYTPSYFSPTKESWLPIIKASSAIPGFYRMGVDLEGVSYQDGGISDAIPVEEAYRRGADTIVVIRTVPSAMVYTPQWIKRMEQWLSESSLQQLVHMVQHHESSYHRIQQFIENPPDNLRIFEIFPPKPLASSALGSRLPALNQDYHLGRRCARYFLSAASHWLLPREKDRAMKPLIPRKTKMHIVPEVSTPVTSETETAASSTIIVPLKPNAKPLPEVLTDSASLAKLLVEDKLLPIASALVTQVKRRVHAKSAVVPGGEPASRDNVILDNSASASDNAKYNLDNSKPNKEAQ
ncbi:patatin-like phospholipase family protein [Rouxiella sp. Mn2063]|uniref:patatin-like phospholipase family protein n=1 Tax=Rouxiella sp. Mn2063 TaxID=3395262 RepID=UPI003BCF27F5